MFTSPLLAYLVSGSIVSYKLLRRQLQPPTRLRFHRLAVPQHRVVLRPAPHADHVVVVPASRVPRLARRQYRLAAVEVVQVDDLPPARGEAIHFVAVIRRVRSLPDRVRVAADRHRPAIEHAVQPSNFTERVLER